MGTSVPSFLSASICSILPAGGEGGVRNGKVLKPRVVLLPISGRGQPFVQFPAERLLGGRAEDAGSGAIPERDYPLSIDHDNGILRGFGQGAKFVFAAAQRILGFLSIRDVHDDALDLFRFPRAVDHAGEVS